MSGATLWRLGITGHRRLAAEAVPALAATLRGVFAAFPEPGLLLTSLAEGADRLAAEAARAEGWRLHAVLPFAEAEYERDFAEPVTPGLSAAACLAGFRALLAASHEVTRLGHPGAPDRDAGYAAASRRVVEAAALLLAVWDGAPGRGAGGTADTVGIALGLGRPVLHLPADGAPPRLLGAGAVWPWLARFSCGA